MENFLGLVTSASFDLVTMIAFLLGLVLVGLVGSSPTGKAEDVRIVGGEDIDITEAPYQVSVMNRGRHSCGGTIVSNDIVVTAAHCVIGTAPTQFQIRAGSSSNKRGGQIVQVGDMAWNPDFSYSNMDGDVAVFWLARPLVFNEAVQPVPMFDAREEIRDGELTVVTGWGNLSEGGGYPATLQRAMIPKVNSDVCSDAYDPLYTISPRMLCAGTPKGGIDACQGDSGGPLVHKGKLAGIVSWGLGCARPDYPGVYAKVSAMRGWIDNQIKTLRRRHVIRSPLDES